MSQEIKFISNAPSGEDLFEGKSQETIANIIVDGLEKNANQKHLGLSQKMIGIEGSWGSGKSNLVKIVEKKINERNAGKFHFFLYDVWGHQEDLQRKAILNELVDFLTKHNIVESNHIENSPFNWEERAKKITGTLIEKKTKNIPKVSTGILLCMLILLMVPVIDKLANLDVFKGGWSVAIALIPVFFSLAFFILYWFYKCIRYFILSIKKRPIIFPIFQAYNETTAELFSFYKDREIESSNKEYVNEINPSVVDIKNFFDDLSKALKTKHLIIFFDNMDRLPKEKIENLWASIHTFFAENNGYHKISCIVSFDREHIKDAFSSCGCGDDYIDKTFDVVYRVAPPILTDWKKFFKTKWQDAFGPVSNQEEYECIIQAYDFLSGKQGLTPRSIIKFINESVLLKKIFSSIPDRYISIFILRKKQLIDNPLDKDCLGNLKPIYENDVEFDKYVAALVYQVPPEKALSAVYIASLKRALDQNDIEELYRISSAPFFADILDDAIKNVDNLDNAIVSLDSLPQESLNEVRTKKLWADLFNSAQEDELTETNATNRLFGVMKKSQEVLLKHVNEKSRIQLIGKLLAPFRKPNYNWQGYTPDTYVNLIKKFNSYLSLEKLTKILPSLKIEPTTYSEILKTHGEFLRKIPFICSNLQSYLAELNHTQLLNLEHLEYLPDETKNQLDTDVLLNNLFSQNTVYNEENFLKLLKLFEAFPKCKMNPKVINWTYLGQLLNSTQNPSLKGVILAIRLINSNHPIAGNLPFDGMLNDPLPENIKAPMLTYFATHSSIEQVLVDEQKLETYKVIQDYIKERLAAGDYEITGNGLFSILPKISQINQILSADLSPLYSKMLEFYESKRDLFKRILESQRANPKNVEKTLPNGTLVFVVQHASNFSKELVQWLISYFNSWTKENWIERFANSSLYGINEALSIKYHWSQNAKEALDEYLIEVVKGNKPVPNKAFLSKIIESLDDNSKKTVFKNIRDEFISGRAKMNLDLFILLGDWLLEYGFVEQFAGDVLRTMVPSFLLENDSASQIIGNHYGLIQSLFAEESESEGWLNKAKEIANDRENYPLKEFLK